MRARKREEEGKKRRKIKTANKNQETLEGGPKCEPRHCLPGDLVVSEVFVVDTFKDHRGCCYGNNELIKLIIMMRDKRLSIR